jgi:hypothetical protein
MFNWETKHKEVGCSRQWSLRDLTTVFGNTEEIDTRKVWKGEREVKGLALTPDYVFYRNLDVIKINLQNIRDIIETAGADLGFF